ncbi:hypothetical protein BY458DRAFT_504258 [Sporodiniella umbellata]|nr:hypothetical protein BY458DRAFT_504258 [Sporodiniella umbellata]
MSTLSSRPRVAHTTRRAKQQKVPEPVILSEEEEEEEEDESVEDESVTRCVCGKQHSLGLMVCCDDCEVWQHCECMGLEEEDIPDQYFCEQCRPEDHVEIRGYDNKTRRYYKPSKTVKKRSTLNSRVASVPPEENVAETPEATSSGAEVNTDSPVEEDSVVVLKPKKALENKPSRPKRRVVKNEKKARPLGNSNTRKWIHHSLRRSNKTPRSRTSTPQPETPIQASTGSILFEHLSPSAREISPPARVRTPSSRMTISEMNKRTNQILEYICSLQVDMFHTKKRKEKRLLQEDEDEEDEEDDICKRRRLIDAQMTETMSKTMVQLEKEESPVLLAENRKPTPILIPLQFDASSSPSSSLSSASTLPLEEDESRFMMDTEKSIAEEALERIHKPKHEQTALEIMDLLTKQVIIFQRRFGKFSFGNATTDDPESIEYEGPPITRSREFYQTRAGW